MIRLKVFVSFAQKEMANAGTLLPTLTLAKLRQPHGSVAGNPLIAGSLYLTKYIERMGTGVSDMIGHCKDSCPSEPDFYLNDDFIAVISRKPKQSLKPVIPQVGFKSALSRYQVAILEKRVADSTLPELMATSEQSDRAKFRQQVINPLISDCLIEKTIPGKPRSRLQKYRLTEKGRAWLAGER